MPLSCALGQIWNVILNDHQFPFTGCAMALEQHCESSLLYPGEEATTMHPVEVGERSSGRDVGDSWSAPFLVTEGLSLIPVFLRMLPEEVGWLD